MNNPKIQKIFAWGLALVVTGLLFGPSPNQKQSLAAGTGWCSDYEGNNFPCYDDSGGGGGGGDYGYGGGGGCATAYENSDAGIAASNSESFLSAGNWSWDEGNYENAADLYQHALESNPNNTTARGNLASAMNKLGNAAYDYGNYESAWLYFNRAVKNATDDSVEIFENNVEAAADYISDYPDCSMCGKAVISDVGYGLRNSAMLQSYANQASNNYANCTQRITEDCGGTDGKWFDDQIYNCRQTFFASEDGFRACLDNAWQSVN